MSQSNWLFSVLLFIFWIIAWFSVGSYKTRNPDLALRIGVSVIYLWHHPLVMGQLAGLQVNHYKTFQGEFGEHIPAAFEKIMLPPTCYIDAYRLEHDQTRKIVQWQHTNQKA